MAVPTRYSPLSTYKCLIHIFVNNVCLTFSIFLDFVFCCLEGCLLCMLCIVHGPFLYDLQQQMRPTMLLQLLLYSGHIQEFQWSSVNFVLKRCWSENIWYDRKNHIGCFPELVMMTNTNIMHPSFSGRYYKSFEHVRSFPIWTDLARYPVYPYYLNSVLIWHWQL